MGPQTRPPVDARTAPTRLAPHRRFFPIAEDSGRPGLHPGEPETARRDLRRFLPIWGHLALILAVIKVYHVEGRALLILTSIAFAALPVHYLLTYRWKQPFFLLASMAGLLAVFGVAAGSMVLALALAFVGATRLPIAWGAKVALVALGALGLGAARVLAGPSGSTLVDVALPVLGSMLMFRMALYLYELKHAKEPEPLLDAVGYFFLLPNYAFLLFPVVDYRAYRRGYFAAEIHQTQLAGLRSITNGMVQLLAYRLVYHELLIPAEEVRGPATLAAFVACNYLLYLQVSGQFHVACGMLGLFGHQLAPTHNNYLLAESFTDYWRRINIYWKDFMIRVVFNPVAFRLKRRPRWQTLAVATTAVFLATWILHAYQMFWLKGSWGFSVPDALFWGVLGTLVLVNVQWDAMEKPRGPKPSKGLRTLGLRAIKTLATFTTIALLWSLWSSPSLAAWLAMLRRGLGG